MDGVFCQSLSLDCVSQSANTNVCLDLCDPEPSLSFLPIWKRELILKKRLSNGVGSCNVHQGIWHAVSFSVDRDCPEEFFSNTTLLFLLCHYRVS